MYDKNILVSIGDIKIDLFEYIDKNSEFLKNQYLDIIFKLSSFILEDQSFKNQLNFKGHSLWEMSLLQEKNIFKNKSIFKTIKYLALKKIISENKNKNIKIFFLEKDLASYLKEEYGDIDLYFFDKSFSLIENFIQKRNKNLLFHFLFFLYFFIKNCSFRKFDYKKFIKKKFLVFSYFTHYDEKKFSKNIFYPKQWSNLWEKINENSNFLQIFIPNKRFKFFFQVENLVTKNSYKDLKKENFINHFIFYKYYLSVFKDFRNIRPKNLFLKIKKKLKDSKNFKYFFEINKEAFVSSFAGYTLLQNILWINIFDNLFKNIPKHEYGIFAFENQPWEKAFIASWKKYDQGKLIGYTHTTINFWHLNYFNIKDYNCSDGFNKLSPDLIAVSSEISKNFLIDQSISSKKIVEVEALRYKWILNKKNSLKNINDNDDKRILFLGDYKIDINDQLIKILNQSKNELKNLGFQISYKPHPSTIVKNIDNEIHLTNEDLEQLIDTHKYIVSSNSTSAIIEALSCGLNTFLFIDKNNFDLSPIKNTKIEKNVNFFCTKEELLYKLDDYQKNCEPIEYYYLNEELIKWKKILEIR